MAWRSAERLIAWLIVVAAAAVAYDGFHLWRDSRVNRALVKLEAGDQVDIDHPRLRFARAFTLQQDGKFEEALEAYVAVGAPDGDPLQADVDYNLANLYFRRALRFTDDGANDLALPLIELAKETYRELLRADSKNWFAKYNLELALRIAPEVDLEEAQEERNPEHNPRSAAGIRVRKALP
jgi:mxaK protein